MKQFKTGVVIGKFYPPHKGHSYLIDTAEKNCQKVTVFVCDARGQKISGELRAEWLRQIHPNVEIRLVKDVYYDDDTKTWAKNTIRWLGYHPEAVFTSEEYGPGYAAMMGATHVLVDKQRVHIPCSGTQIRTDPLGNLQYLNEVVRRYFVKRVCVIGAESTGTTTMARALAKELKTIWVPEYGREFSEKLPDPFNYKWKTKDFIEIAKNQNQNEDELAGKANKVLICDTDSFATGIWHERYMGRRSLRVEQLSENRKYDLYLLTDIDIPFIQDGLRDGEHIREWMHKLFIQRLTECGKKFIILSGSHEKRLQVAKKAIKEIFNKSLEKPNQ